MGGQVLGGGIIVLVTVVLWLVYLLPSWHQRHQYDAAERNAVRLNQALRVLAETSETPDEVRLELTARTAMAQQKIARRAQADREHLARKAQAERDELARKAQAERNALARDAQVARDRVARRELLAREQVALARAAGPRPTPEGGSIAAAGQDPVAGRRAARSRLARVRRRVRLATTMIGMLSLGLAAWGVYALAAMDMVVPLVAGSALAIACALLLVRMARVGARATVADGQVVTSFRPRARQAAQDVSLEDERVWQPRELPRPLTASAGSRAAAVLDAADAHEQLRQAALDESLHERAERERPAGLDAERVARMGHVDDAEIEAHVRQLLHQRTAV